MKKTHVPALIINDQTPRPVHQHSNHLISSCAAESQAQAILQKE